MQGEKRAIPCLCSSRRIAIAIAVLVFLTHSVCAQDTRWKQECENLFSAAVTAEQQNNAIEAQIRYEQCQEIARKHRLPQMEAAALHRLAVLRARNKKFTESADFFRRAAALDPKNAMILCDFAQLYADRKAYDDAERMLKNALSLEPNNPKILFNLGVIIASQQNERQTEGLRYLKLAVGEAEAYRELAKIYRSKGDIGRAEFAEQRAKLAVNQPTDNPQAASYTLTADTVPIRPPHTPPEVVNRVRQELADSEVREIVAAQQRTPTPLVTQPPFIPAPISPADPEKITVVPSGTATDVNVVPFPIIASEAPAQSVAELPPPPADPPVDPFASLRQPELPPVIPQQTALPAVQTIPSRSEPLLVIQPSARSKMLDTITFVQATESKSTNSSSSEPQLIKIPSPTATEPNSPQRLPVSEELNRQINVQPIRVLPNGEKRVGQSGQSNPLRQIPPGRAGLIDPSADTSLIASLPSYSAVGIKRISGTDQRNNLQEHSGNVLFSVRDVPKATEPKPPALTQPKSIAMTLESVQTAEKNEPVRVPRPAKDVDVLQSPSAMVARRDVSVSKPDVPNPASERKPYTVVNLSAEPQKPAMAKQEPSSEQKLPEYARIIPSEQRFTSAAAPAVLKFGATRNDPTPEIQANKPIEIASKPPATNTLPPIASRDARPLLIIKDKLDDPQSVAVAPASPFPIAADDPFGKPQFVEVQRIESQTPLPMQAAVTPHDPFPVVDDQFGKPKFTEVKNIEPRTPLPMQAAVAPLDPFPVVNDQVAMPKFAEVKKIEPRTPLPVQAAVAPPDPFIATNHMPMAPKFAEVKKPEPPPEVAILPVEMPKDVFVQKIPKEDTLSNPLPIRAEAKQQEQRSPEPVPILAEVKQPEQRNLEPMPTLAEVKQPERRNPEPMPTLAEVKPRPIQQPVPVRESMIKPLPVHNDPTGFASTRKTTRPVELSEEQPIGFARSRK